jgi:peptide deformylase
MLREILHFPNKSLTKTSAAVENMDGGLSQLVEDMVETMYDAPGVGLAAPQVGTSQRIVVLDVNHEEPGKDLLKLINPAITDREGSIIWEEGCLSVVDYTAEVKRSAKVEVKAWTIDQKEIVFQAEELLAVALQHELDHLDGKLFIDRISRLKREMYSRRVKKLIREGRPLKSEDDPPAI